MDDASRADAEAALADAVGIWRTSPVEGAKEVVDAATELLVIGVDSPSLRMLAGVSPRESQFIVEPVLVSALEEIGLSVLLEGNAHRAALAARLRRFLDSRITLRDLSRWAHGAIGHEGDPDCQPFVLLDDIYDDWESAGHDLAPLEAIARHEATAFLTGKPSTGFEDLWPPTSVGMIQDPQPRGSWLDRLKRALSQARG